MRCHLSWEMSSLIKSISWDLISYKILSIKLATAPVVSIAFATLPFHLQVPWRGCIKSCIITSSSNHRLPTLMLPTIVLLPAPRPISNRTILRHTTGIAQVYFGAGIGSHGRYRDSRSYFGVGEDGCESRGRRGGGDYRGIVGTVGPNQILLADMLVALNVPFIEGKRLSRRHHLAGVKSGTMGREDTLASLRWE